MVWKVPIVWKMYGFIDVDAETAEEAIEIARRQKTTFPKEKYYLDGTRVVNCIPERLPAYLPESYNGLRTNFYENVMSHDEVFVFFCFPHNLLVNFNTCDLSWSKDKLAFFLSNLELYKCTVETYGETWAFTREELLHRLKLS